MLTLYALALALTPPSAEGDTTTVPPQGYERFVEPQSLDGETRRLAHVVRSYGHRRHLKLSYDWRLMQAAQHLASQTQAPLDLESVRRRAQALGWTDGELAAVVVTSRPPSLPRALNFELIQALQDSDINALGLAWAKVPATTSLQPEETVVVLASRRLVHLGPVPALIEPNRRVHLSGTLAHGAITQLRASLCCPDGRVVSAPIHLGQLGFAGSFGVGRQPGILQVEILAERGRGPEVAAAFPIFVGDHHQAHTSPLSASEQHAAQAPTQTPTAKDVLALVLAARASHNLELPVVNPRLMQVAQEHAQDMAQHHFFAHVSPNHGDATARLRAAREPYLHVVENIAQDSDVPRAFAQWLASPGHLGNLLDSRVQHLGVGLAPTGPLAHRSWLIVLLMTQKPK